MTSNTSQTSDYRVLIFAPTGRDAELTCSFLLRAGISAQRCRDMSDVVHKVQDGCGAIVLAEEALGTTSVQTLTNLLARQPSWSEIPICIIALGGEGNGDTSRRLSIFGSAGNVTVLERPFRPHTLVNTLQVALRSRRRQYQVRDLLDERTTLLERFRLMAEAMPQKVFTTTASGEFNYVNRQWTEFTGLAPEELATWNWKDVVHPDDVQETLRRWNCALQTGKPFQAEHRFRRKDDVCRWHLSRAHALRDSKGKIVMWIGSDTDIEDQKRAEANLEKLVAERTGSLQETNKQLEAFCYTISHDLRAPLRAQQGFSAALLEEFGDVLGQTGCEYAERIRQAAARLDRLVQDLLNYSRISREEIPLSELNLHSAATAVCEEMAYEIATANAQVELSDLHYAVLAHDVTLRTALTNLVANAIKFAKPGVPSKVRIWAQPLGEQIRIWVEDDGIGIAPEHHRQIFGVFNRLHKAGEHPGTGVGLAIVEKGVERMGGRVGVESKDGEGSRFWMELKVLPAVRKTAAGTARNAAE